jgi:hypothetical protein
MPKHGKCSLFFQWICAWRSLSQPSGLGAYASVGAATFSAPTFDATPGLIFAAWHFRSFRDCGCHYGWLILSAKMSSTFWYSSKASSIL